MAVLPHNDSHLHLTAFAASHYDRSTGLEIPVHGKVFETAKMDYRKSII